MFDPFIFDHLPMHIRETIFSRVRYVDLFETSRVSQEWWTLSLASFKRFLHSEEDFLLDQVDFCNEMMPKEEPWQWWMFMEFTKSKRLHLNKDDFASLFNETTEKLIQYFGGKEINVQELKIRKNMYGFGDLLRLPPNLNQLFPDLRSIELNGVDFKNGLTVVLPPKLEVVGLHYVKIAPRTALSSIVTDLSKLKVLELTGYRSSVYFDGRNCGNLTRLGIDANCLSSEDETGINLILRTILNQNKRLKSVSLVHFKINKDWLRMFPSNVVELELIFPHLIWDLVQLFGKNTFHERMLLFYIFEDLKSVADFRIYIMSRDKDEYGVSIWSQEYQIKYLCKPYTKQEEIQVLIQQKTFALNEVISQNTQGFELSKLSYERDHFLYAVPRTVRNLKFGWPERPGDSLVLQDPSVLETLLLNPRHSSVINSDYLSKMINLRMLSYGKCDSRRLACVLDSCTSLAELRLEPSHVHVFKGISSDVQSVSLRRLTIVDGDDTFADILKHFSCLRMLYLEGHAAEAILQSEVKAVSHLQYFKAVGNRNDNVAHHLSSLEFPYMIFAGSDALDLYAVSKGPELMNELSMNASHNNYVNAERLFILNSESKSEKLYLVYTKNIPKRFLRNSFVYTTIHDFTADLYA